MYGGDASGDARWVVVLEAATGIEERALQRVLRRLTDLHAVALHCPSRYAVQMEIIAGGQAGALFVALARWRSAVAFVGHSPTDVVRAEVLCPEEFERDCRLAYDDEALGHLDADEGIDGGLRLLSR